MVFDNEVSFGAMVAAGLALALVVLEIYSLGAFLVAQRTREMGIRLVLGAGSRRMFWTVVVGGLGSSRHFSASTGAGRGTTLLLSARSSSALRVCRLAGFHDNGILRQPVLRLLRLLPASESAFAQRSTEEGSPAGLGRKGYVPECLLRSSAV